VAEAVVVALARVVVAGDWDAAAGWEATGPVQGQAATASVPVAAPEPHTR